MRGLAALTLGLALLAAPASAAAPRMGIVVPGRSFDGLALGAARADVRAAWGSRFGACRGCRDETWYFNFRRFEPEGVGVAFRHGRAVAFFTLWAPKGWRTSGGLRIGEPVAARGTGVRVNCGTYYALTSRSRRAVTTIYVRDEKVWGFGLSRPSLPVCR